MNSTGATTHAFHSPPPSLNTPTGNPVFVEELKPTYICQECRHVLHNPVQLPCGHLVCEDNCLAKLFRDSSEILCEYENCGTYINKTQVKFGFVLFFCPLELFHCFFSKHY